MSQLCIKWEALENLTTSHLPFATTYTKDSSED